MKRLIFIVFGFFVPVILSFGQTTLNSSADSILGTYEVIHHGELSKVEVIKEPAGTYMARVIWVEQRLDEDGNVRLDEKNPDKSLRHIECDRIVLITGLEYEPEKERWGNTKVYDPIRGFRANVHCEFTSDGLLRVRGSLLGFSQSIYWRKL